MGEYRFPDQDQIEQHIPPLGSFPTSATQYSVCSCYRTVPTPAEIREYERKIRIIGNKSPQDFGYTKEVCQREYDSLVTGESPEVDKTDARRFVACTILHGAVASLSTEGKDVFDVVIGMRPRERIASGKTMTMKVYGDHVKALYQGAEAASSHGNAVSVSCTLLDASNIGAEYHNGTSKNHSKLLDKDEVSEFYRRIPLYAATVRKFCPSTKLVYNIGGGGHVKDLFQQFILENPNALDGNFVKVMSVFYHFCTYGGAWARYAWIII